jgi:hypothetical protein
MTNFGFLIASFEGLQAVRERLNSASSSRDTAVLFMAGLAIAAFWAGLYFWDRHRRPAPTANPLMGLFADLCRVHSLSHEQKLLLQAVAGEHSNPAIVFVDPHFLDHHRQVHPAAAAACDELRAQLFGAPGHIDTR